MLKLPQPVLNGRPGPAKALRESLQCFPPRRRKQREPQPLFHPVVAGGLMQLPDSAKLRRSKVQPRAVTSHDAHYMHVT